MSVAAGTFASLVMTVHRPYHDALTRSPIMSRILDKTLPTQDYVNYLEETRHDLGRIEHLMSDQLAFFELAPEIEQQARELGITTLDSARDAALRAIAWKDLFRFRWLTFDIRSFGSQPAVLPVSKSVLTHLKHYEGLPPYLLAAHASMFYLAALFGGQRVAANVEKMYGSAVKTQYYKFADGTRQRLMQQMSNLYDTLDETERVRFIQETERAWQFQGDLVGVDLVSKVVAEGENSVANAS